MLLAVAAGGAVGTLGRYGVGEALPVEPGAFPWSTFLVNVAGAFVLALVVRTVRDRLASAALGSGLCGALTTFSTFQLEVVHLLDRGDLALGAGYAVGSVAAGLAAVVLAGRAG